jgi:hypothetical protein
MIRPLFIYFIILLLIIVGFSLSVFAKQSTQNGVTIDTFKAKGKDSKQFFQAKILDNFDPDGTEVFNPASGVSITSGSIDTTQYTEDLTVQISVPTLGSTGIDVTAYGQFTIKESAEGWVPLWTESISTITTNSTLKAFTIQEQPVRTRVGTASTGVDGTDDCTVLLLGRGPTK